MRSAAGSAHNQAVRRLLLLAWLAAAVVAVPANARPATLHACLVAGTPARCGTLSVPENRAAPHGRQIELSLVVIPSLERPARPDAFTYLAGGPGGGATASASFVLGFAAGLHVHHDIVLVDQRGTTGSHPLECPPPTRDIGPRNLGAYVQSCLQHVPGDPTQYGTMAAADDLEAVRTALGYRSFDVYGASYGATLAQAFLIRHPRSVRTIVLDGGTLVGIPFYSRFAANGERALDAVAARCYDSPACRAAFPHWRGRLDRLIRAWNRKPARLPDGRRLSGDDLAGVVQSLTLSAEGAAVIPYDVAHAAAGDLGPLAEHVGVGGPTRSLMFWSIWCNEPWVGLRAHWSRFTYLDAYTRQTLALDRLVCSKLPARDEPAVDWRLPHSNVPVLALVGGADPQDPLGNLTGLRRHLPNARIVVVPGMGHTIGQYGCLGALVSGFVDRGGAAKLDTACVRDIHPPPFLVLQ
jgi:pimeloyl-ACP methyl ester carboxylesterase